MRVTTTPSPSSQKEKYQKANLFENDNPEELEDVCLHQSQIDTSKKSLRIDEKTIVLVDAALCTPEHAEYLKRKFERARKQRMK